jgi:Ca-activated chloride channel family protein
MSRRMNDAPHVFGRQPRPAAALLAIVTLIPITSYGASQSAPDTLEANHEEPRVSIVPRRSESKAPKSDIRVDVNVVLIPVTVTDQVGKTVLGLPSEAFHISEDGVEQPLAHLVRQDAPLSVGLVFDSSKSMDDKLDKSREAITQFLQTSMPGDEYFLVEFNDKPKVLTGFTPEVQDIDSALMSIRPKGWTALLDAIQLSVSRMKKARNPRRALVVLSDGGDNNSRYSQSEIRTLLRESNVSLYAIGILGHMVTAGAMKLLGNLAEETGGRLFPVHNLNQLPDAIAKLNTALRDQYMLAYYPTNPSRDGKYRRVQVRVVTPPDLPSLHASWRVGYYAPD